MENTTGGDSLETKLKALANFGIKPCVDFFPSWFTHEWGDNPLYELILFSLGGEGEGPDGQWVRLSHDIYRFDTECIVDNQSYPVILQNLSDLTGGELVFEEVTSSIDHDQEKASLHFVCRGAVYDLKLNYEGDWFDPRVLEVVDSIIANDDDDRRFYKYIPDQTITIIYNIQPFVTLLNIGLKVNFK